MSVYPELSSPEANAKLFKENLYVGRPILQGVVEDVAVQCAALTGRHDNDSRNRRYVEDDGAVAVEVVDKSKPAKHPELTEYTAMQSKEGMHVVSNGNQTDTVIECVKTGKRFADAIGSRTFEHDLHRTPRVTAALDLWLREAEETTDDWFLMSIIRKPPVSKSDLPSRLIFGNRTNRQIGDALKSGKGAGFGLQTYKSDSETPESPVPSYDGGPFAFPMKSDPEEMVNFLWDCLHPINRVAAAAKIIHLNTGQAEIALKNKHK